MDQHSQSPASAPLNDPAQSTPHTQQNALSRTELIQKYHQQLVGGIERIKAHLTTPGLPMEKISFLTKKQTELEGQLSLFRNKYMSTPSSSFPSSSVDQAPGNSYARSEFSTPNLPQQAMQSSAQRNVPPSANQMKFYPQHPQNQITPQVAQQPQHPQARTIPPQMMMVMMPGNNGHVPSHLSTPPSIYPTSFPYSSSTPYAPSFGGTQSLPSGSSSASSLSFSFPLQYTPNSNQNHQMTSSQMLSSQTSPPQIASSMSPTPQMRMMPSPNISSSGSIIHYPQHLNTIQYYQHYAQQPPSGFMFPNISQQPSVGMMASPPYGMAYKNNSGFSFVPSPNFSPANRMNLPVGSMISQQGINPNQSIPSQNTSPGQSAMDQGNARDQISVTSSLPISHTGDSMILPNDDLNTSTASSSAADNTVIPQEHSSTTSQASSHATTNTKLTNRHPLDGNLTPYSYILMPPNSQQVSPASTLFPHQQSVIQSPAMPQPSQRFTPMGTSPPSLFVQNLSTDGVKNFKAQQTTNFSPLSTSPAAVPDGSHSSSFNPSVVGPSSATSFSNLSNIPGRSASPLSIVRRSTCANRPVKTLSQIANSVYESTCFRPGMKWLYSKYDSIILENLAAEELIRNVYSYLQFLVFSTCLSAKMSGNEGINPEDLSMALHVATHSWRNSLKTRVTLPSFPLDVKTFPIRRVQRRSGLLVHKLAPSLFCNSLAAASSNISSKKNSNASGIYPKLSKRSLSKAQRKDTALSVNCPIIDNDNIDNCEEPIQPNHGDSNYQFREGGENTT